MEKEHEFEVNDVIVTEKAFDDKYYLVTEVEVEGSINTYMLKEISFDETMSHKEYRMMFGYDLPKHCHILK